MGVKKITAMGGCERCQELKAELKALREHGAEREKLHAHTLKMLDATVDERDAAVERLRGRA